MKLFAALKQIRDFERGQLPFLKSIVDFDILIDVGYAEENDKPLTIKQVQLMSLSDQGVIKRRKNPLDHRSSHLTVSPSSLKTFGKYGTLLAATCALISN